MENNVEKAHLSASSEPGELLLLAARFQKRCIVVSSSLYVDVLRLLTPAGPPLFSRTT
jgi:hypothetical protein